MHTHKSEHIDTANGEWLSNAARRQAAIKTDNSSPAAIMKQPNNVWEQPLGFLIENLCLMR